MRKLAIGILACLVLGSVSACATLARQAFGQPKVSLTNVRLTGVGFTGGSLMVVLKVHNPNGYRLDATKLSYRVDVDSTLLGQGVVDHRFTVGPKDSTLVDIPVTFAFSGLGAAGKSLLNTGVVNYHVTGAITVATPIGDFTVPFVQEGHFSTTGGTF